jgi:hypothetical protein
MDNPFSDPSLWSRRRILKLGIFSAIPGVAALLSAGDAGASTLVLTLPAKQMQDRADKFRNDFVVSYLRPNAPYPIYSVLYRSGLLPDNIDAERAIGSRGSLVFNGNKMVFSHPSNAQTILPYHALMADQLIGLEVAVPQDLEITIAQSGDSLTFGLNPSIGLKVLDKIRISGIVLPIPSQLRFTSATLSKNALRYNLSNASKPDDRYAVILDFTNNTGSPSITSARDSSRPRNASAMAIFCLLLLVATPACVNHGPYTGQAPSQPPPTPYPDKEICFNQPAPTDFIRIDSKAAGLVNCPSTGPTDFNVDVYTDYVNRSSGDQLLVCADAPLPTAAGWVDVSGSYHDEQGCDALKYSGTTYANVRLIRKS